MSRCRSWRHGRSCATPRLRHRLRCHPARRSRPASWGVVDKSRSPPRPLARESARANGWTGHSVAVSTRDAETNPASEVRSHRTSSRRWSCLGCGTDSFGKQCANRSFSTAVVTLTDRRVANLAGAIDEVHGRPVPVSVCVPSERSRYPVRRDTRARPPATARSTFPTDRSNENSGLWTPTTVKWGWY